MPAAADPAVLHQCRAAVGRRLGHRVGRDVHQVGAQLTRAYARTHRSAAPVQERPAQGARVRQRLFRRHAQAVLHTRARRLRHRQHIQNSREPRRGRAVGLRFVPGTRENRSPVDRDRGRGHKGKDCRGL